MPFINNPTNSAMPKFEDTEGETLNLSHYSAYAFPDVELSADTPLGRAVETFHNRRSHTFKGQWKIVSTLDKGLCAVQGVEASPLLTLVCDETKEYIHVCQGVAARIVGNRQLVNEAIQNR